jgi:hypothetical protein
MERFLYSFCEPTIHQSAHLSARLDVFFAENFTALVDGAY